MAPKIVDKSERKQTIARGALEVFSRAGFEKATLASIAVECGVGKGTLYEYFNSKEDLFLEAVLLWMHQLETETMNRLHSKTDSTASPLSQLRTYLLTTVDVFTHDPYFKRMSIVMTHLMISHTDWLVKSEMMAKSTEAFRGMIVDLIHAAVELKELPNSALKSAEHHAINLIAGMDGIELHASISECYLDASHQYQIYVDTYLKGIRHS